MFLITSLETRSSSLYSKIPLSCFSDAFLKEALILSASAGFFITATRSTREPTETGTRTAKPLTFPVSSGRTAATASAAPVEVGIMLSAPALPLLRFLWN